MPLNIEESQIPEYHNKIPFYCKVCGCTFYKNKTETMRVLSGERKGLYCSRSCQYADSDRSRKKRKPAKLECSFCAKIFYRQYPRTESKRYFCKASCAALYYAENPVFKHRSSVEKFMEEKIRETFPALSFKANDRTTLQGLELDFFFPELRFAIEVNGIVHYAPIYGNDRFESVVANDKQKVFMCKDLGIELCTVNCNFRLNKKNLLKMWEEVQKILDSIKDRAVSRT